MWRSPVNGKSRDCGIKRRQGVDVRHGKVGPESEDNTIINQRAEWIRPFDAFRSLLEH